MSNKLSAPNLFLHVQTLLYSFGSTTTKRQQSKEITTTYAKSLQTVENVQHKKINLKQTICRT